MVTMSRASGAGTYSHSKPASSDGGRAVSAICPSVDREVVGRLVHAAAFLGDLHEDVVEQAGGAEPEAVGRHPVRAQRFVEHDQVLDGGLGGADAAGGLEADDAAGLAVEIADR